MSGPCFITQDNAEAPLALAGGKGLALLRLRQAGFPVPDFFIITPRAFADGDMRDEALAQLDEHLSAIAPGPFAVRSSASGEDGGAHSHAGQLLSLLDVEPADVAKAAGEVWRSGFTSSLRAYREAQGLDGDAGAPSVVVQRMVKARCAGVVFGADPVSGRRDRMVISAVSGLADALVSGEADGANYLLSAATGKVVSHDGEDILSGDDIAALAEACARAQEVFGAPQDMEWAFEGDELRVVQSRPITSPLRPAPAADDEITIFDNSNIVESYPGLVSPLTYTFARYAYDRVYRMFVRILGVDARTIAASAPVFANMLARVDGRVYYNLVNWYRALALLPGFSLNRAYMETMMGVDEPLPDEVTRGIGPPPAKGLARLGEWVRLSRSALLLAFEAMRLPRTIRAFYARLNSALARPAAELDAMTLGGLAREYRRIEAGLLDRWDAPLINDFLCMMAFGASRKLMRKWAGSEGEEYHNEVMIGQGGIISAEPARRIRRMGEIARRDPALVERLAAGDAAALKDDPQLAQEARAYIDKFGDRCSEELKLESITLDEDATPLALSVAAAARNRAGQAAPRHGKTLAEIFKGRPLRRLIAGWIVNRAKNRVRDRENLRFERTRIFGRARKLFLAAGRQFHAHGLMDDPRDIFYLTIDEALGAMEGYGLSSDLSGLIALRKAEQSGYEKLPDPPARITLRGPVLPALRDYSASHPPAAAEDGGVRKGLGCSAGRVRAVARVIRDPRRQSLGEGEILVARHTDPGWIALFSAASAIVVERGSLLSHSAIVARELGIPCVVGLKGATDWIGDGQTIAVDGATGEVRKTDD